MHNAVPDAVLFDERRNGACSPRGVDDVDVVVMAVGAALLRVDILPQRRVQQRTLQVVRGKSVARQQAVGIAVFDERLHGRLADASKLHAGPSTHTTLPCSFSWRSSPASAS